MTISHFSVHVQSHAVVGLGIFLGGELKESKLQVHTTTKVLIAQAAILKFVNSIYLSTKKFQLQKKKKRSQMGGGLFTPLDAPLL